MLSADRPKADHSSLQTSRKAVSAFFANERKSEMREDEVAISFLESFIRKERITVPTGDGESFELNVIEMPDEEGDEHEIKRTFTVPVSRVYTDRKYSYVKYTYLKKDKEYKVMRCLFDEDARSKTVEESYTMTGQQIANVFNRYRDRKRKEQEKSFMPDGRKEEDK